MKKKIDYTKLKRIREERRITQKEMSSRMNMTQSNYSKIESGKKVIDSFSDLNNLAKALSLPVARLISILTDDNPLVVHAGIHPTELFEIQHVTRENPLREDEFVLFTTPVLDINKHAFKSKFKETNWEEIDEEDFEFRPWEYSEPINVFRSDGMEVGFEFYEDDVVTITLWLGSKQLGVITYEYTDLVQELIHQGMLSRVVLIGNEIAVRGFMSTYMKAAFVISNAVCKKISFDKGRFRSLNLMDKEEIEQSQ